MTYRDKSSLSRLWRTRERPTSPGRFVRIWLKRLVHLGTLSGLLLRSSIASFRGARLEPLVILGKSRIEGDWSRLAIGTETALGRCQIVLHDRVTIGRRTVINDGAILLTATHSTRDPTWRTKTGPIVIGEYVWIATNAIVLPGVTIGSGAVIGAGSVVRSDVPAFSVVAGNPAVKIGDRPQALEYSPVWLSPSFEAWRGHSRDTRLSEL